ncbi:hypothetical protein JST97_25200 [bacterium]|nr:hypothetical protein [bacterium]
MRRAFIVPALLVVAIFMVLCVGLLSRQPMRNLGAMQSQYQVQARQVALAGIEEARLRLAGDSAQTLTNTTFSRDLSEAGGAPVGSYLVNIDSSWCEEPFCVLRVESEGFYGAAIKPQARYVLRVTLDVRPELAPNKLNPDYLQLLRWQESVP